MDSFEFEHDGLYKAEIDDSDDLSIWLDPTGSRDCWEMYDENIVGPKASCIRALFANRAEVMALYREAMEVARESLGDLSDDTVCREKQLNALDARFKKLEAGQ